MTVAITPVALGIRCRQIGDADLTAVARLLFQGFPERSHAYWAVGLERLRHRCIGPGLPRYGYILESDGRPVGVIILIFATTNHGGTETARCNLSSWYVEPAFKGYAPLLINQAIKRKGVTYFNISPAPHTWPVVEAQGFIPFGGRRFLAFPALASTRGGCRIEPFETRSVTSERLAPEERALLGTHAAFGCLSFSCVTDACASPFVFLPRSLKRMIPAAQLIFCRDIADFARWAGPIGRFLARQGRFVAIVDGDGPIQGLPGACIPGRAPRYFKGTERPRVGDLSNSELVVFGP